MQKSILGRQSNYTSFLIAYLLNLINILILSIEKTFRTMFWSIFLIGNSEVVVIEPFENNLTLIFGYLMFALYHIINITVMINMLIAMMARSYDSILVRNDI